MSPGCAHCYADTLSKRNPLTLGVWGPNGTRVVASESAWREPLKWDRAAKAAGERHRVFCASLADVYEDWQGGKDYPGEMVNAKGGRLSINASGQVWSYDTDGPPEDDWGVRAYTMGDARRRLFRLIERTPNLDWLLLTKRPENVLRMWNEGHSEALDRPWPSNVWLGTSVESQATADARIPHLLRAPAAVRFLSCEPLLGPVDLTNVSGARDESPDHLNALTGVMTTSHPPQAGPRVDWVIVGGESGPGARPMHPDWARSLRDQCRAADVAFHFKQWGEWVPVDEAVGTAVVTGDGSRVRAMFPDGSHAPDLTGSDGDEAIVIGRVGKAAAGRVLDGRTWDEFPSPAPVPSPAGIDDADD